MIRSDITLLGLIKLGSSIDFNINTNKVKITSILVSKSMIDINVLVTNLDSSKGLKSANFKLLKTSNGVWEADTINRVVDFINFNTKEDGEYTSKTINS